MPKCNIFGVSNPIMARGAEGPVEGGMWLDLGVLTHLTSGAKLQYFWCFKSNRGSRRKTQGIKH